MHRIVRLCLKCNCTTMEDSPSNGSNVRGDFFRVPNTENFSNDSEDLNAENGDVNKSNFVQNFPLDINSENLTENLEELIGDQISEQLKQISEAGNNVPIPSECSPQNIEFGALNESIDGYVNNDHELPNTIASEEASALQLNASELDGNDETVNTKGNVNSAEVNQGIEERVIGSKSLNINPSPSVVASPVGSTLNSPRQSRRDSAPPSPEGQEHAATPRSSSPRSRSRSRSGSRSRHSSPPASPMSVRSGSGASRGSAPRSPSGSPVSRRSSAPASPVMSRADSNPGQ